MINDICTIILKQFLFLFFCDNNNIKEKNNNNTMKIEIRCRLTDCLHIAHNTCQDLKSKQQTS